MLIRDVQQATSPSLARKGTRKMLKRVLTIIGLTMTLVVFAGLALKYGSRNFQANIGEVNLAPEEAYTAPVVAEHGFNLEVLVDGRRLPEYAARCRPDVDA